MVNIDQDIISKKVIHQHWDNPMEFLMTCIGKQKY
jgi:hypothetical protein